MLGADRTIGNAAARATAAPNVPSLPLPGLGTTRNQQVRGYVPRAIVLDAVAIAIAIVIGFFARYMAMAPLSPFELVYGGLAMFAVVWWFIALAVGGCYDTQIVGIGPTEIRRILLASVWLFVLLVTVNFFRTNGISRNFVVATILSGTILLIAGRLVLRQWLYARRRNGALLANTLVIGSPDAVLRLTKTITENSIAGYQVACTAEPLQTYGADVDEWLDGITDKIELYGVQAVAVSHAATLDPELIRRLGWRLEGPRVDLLVEPSYGHLTGPRVTYRPAQALPLIHLDEPHLIGTRRFLKRLMDIVMAAAGLILLSPFLITIAILIRLTSKGPAFYTQARIGFEGRTFQFVKFRTMIDGAHEMRAHVLGPPDEGMPERYRNDPRITRVGRFLRRWSLDELPQLLNVLVGSMSMVGPRPMLQEEMHLLADRDHRRHITKPGLTGLWQVSGRKEVNWDERMRLDLYYVENWSPMFDVVIIVRTIKAVAEGQGAH